MTSNINRKVFIDSTTFLGMHSDDERIRVESVNFFSSRFNSSLYMSAEQVGICDEIVWSYTREIQDLYYPFMDRIHTEMDINRVSYSYQDINLVIDDDNLNRLSTSKALLMAQVINNDGVIYTHDHNLLNNEIFSKYIGTFDSYQYLRFKSSLSESYSVSKALKVNIGNVIYE